MPSRRSPLLHPPRRRGARGRALVTALVAAALGASAAACSGSSTGPGRQAALADELDQLAAEANGRGDGDLGTALGDAAGALRTGIEPSRLTIAIAGRTETFTGFVQVVARPADDGRPMPPEVRTLTAWRDIGAGKGIALTVHLPAESAPILPVRRGGMGSPAAPSALASIIDRESRTIFIGTAGSVRIAQLGLGAACPLRTRDAMPRRGPVMTCTIASFSVRLDGTFHARTRGGLDEAEPIQGSVAQQTVGGARWDVRR